MKAINRSWIPAVALARAPFALCSLLSRGAIVSVNRPAKSGSSTSSFPRAVLLFTHHRIPPFGSRTHSVLLSTPPIDTMLSCCASSSSSFSPFVDSELFFFGGILRMYVRRSQWKRCLGLKETRPTGETTILPRIKRRSNTWMPLRKRYELVQ